MVHIIEITHGRPYQQDGSYTEFKKRYTDINERVRFSNLWRDGEGLSQLTAEQVPKKIKITGLRKTAKLPDAFRVLNGLPLVSDPLRNIIEQLDPKLHQFFPVEVALPAGREPDTGYNVFIVTTKKRTIMPELSDVSGPSRWGSYNLQSPGSNVSFSPECREGAHIWREERFRGQLFMSDELEAAMRSEELNYLKYWSGIIVDT